jgi:dTDP-glucose 4,6-dehydratase
MMIGVFVTSGAGFIGANFILDWIAVNDEAIVNIDNLTYAGNLESLIGVEANKRYTFINGDIADKIFL